MENALDTSVNQPPSIPEGDPSQWPKHPHKKRDIIITLSLMLFFVVAAIAYVFLSPKKSVESPSITKETVSPTPMPTAVVSCDLEDKVICGDGTFTYQEPPTCNFKKCSVPTKETSDAATGWKTYTISSLNMTIALPPALQTNYAETEMESFWETKICFGENKSEKYADIPFKWYGQALCNNIPENALIEIAAASTNLQTARDGNYTDFNGYVIKDGKYFVHITNNSKTFELLQEAVSMYKTPLNREFLILSNIDEASIDPDVHYPQFVPRPGQYVAITNTDIPNYPGVVIQTRTISLTELKKILNTVTFTK